MHYDPEPLSLCDILDLIQASKRTNIVPDSVLHWLDGHGYAGYAENLRFQNAVMQALRRDA